MRVQASGVFIHLRRTLLRLARGRIIVGTIAPMGRKLVGYQRSSLLGLAK
jgi:hypothetical protein